MFDIFHLLCWTWIQKKRNSFLKSIYTVFLFLFRSPIWQPGDLLSATMVHLHGGAATWHTVKYLWKALDIHEESAGKWRRLQDKSRLVKHNYIPVGGEGAALKGKHLTWDSCMETSCGVGGWGVGVGLNCGGKKAWIKVRLRSYHLLRRIGFGASLLLSAGKRIISFTLKGREKVCWNKNKKKKQASRFGSEEFQEK